MALGQKDSPQEGPTLFPARRKSLLRICWEWTRTLLVAFTLFLLSRALLIEAFKIPTSSMEGTLLVGDFLLVNKAVYGSELPGTDIRLPAFADPELGDVIVFVPPHEPDKHYVKRVVGIPGDVLEMKDKALIRNGRRIDEPYVRQERSGFDRGHQRMAWQFDYLTTPPRRGRYKPTRDNWGPLKVPWGKYFVLGDNRDNSEDSRYWGFVERDAVEGRPWMVYYSFDSEDGGRFSWLRNIRWDRIGGKIE